MKSKSIFVFSLVIVAMFCVLGWFSRPYPADEYFFSWETGQKGIIQSVISQYNNTNGRLTNHFMMDFFTSLPLESIYPFMASLNSLTYILACLSLVSALFPTIALGAKLSLSFLMCAMTLCFTFSLHDTFYWLAGMPYFWSGTLIILALSLAVRALRGSGLSFILCMAVLFLNGTLLEQPSVFQGVIAFLAMLLFAARGDKKRAGMAGIFWLMSVTAFCVMYFAPGNAARMASKVMGSQSAISRILGGFVPAFSVGILNTLQFFAKPVIYAVIFFLPAIARKIPPADEKLSLRLKAWHIVAAMFAVSMFMQFMMGVITAGKSGLPERGVSLSLWMMYFTWNILWIYFYRGRLIHSEGFRNFCAKFRWPVLILSVLVSANFRECVSALRTAPEYAADYAGRIETILAQRAEGMTVLRVPRLKVKTELIFADVDESEEWTGTGLARYYGAEKLYIVPDELAGDSEAVRKLMSADIEPLSVMAEKGDTASMFYLGSSNDIYINRNRPGKGNADASEKWYRMGAERGEPRCMRRLSRVIMNKNLPEAVYWLTKYHIVTTRL